MSILTYNYNPTVSNPLWDGLYSAYKAESNANDSLGVNNGTPYGGLTYNTGVDGNAFEFNGTNAYVALPNNSMNIIGDFSYSLWVNLQGVGANAQMLLSNIQFSTLTAFYGWEFYVENSILFIYLFDGTASYDSFSYNIGSYYYNWTMFSVSIIGSEVKLYINGVLINTFTKTKNITYTTTHYPSIGVRHSDYGPAPFQYYCKNTTKIDEVYIWGRGVSPTEITELYNSGVGTFY